jgi:hypothetical protein
MGVLPSVHDKTDGILSRIEPNPSGSGLNLIRVFNAMPCALLGING